MKSSTIVMEKQCTLNCPIESSFRELSVCCLRSVTPAEIVDAIFQQTGRQLDRKDVELPDMPSLGTYQASIKLHPEVTGSFNVVVQREKNT